MMKEGGVLCNLFGRCTARDNGRYQGSCGAPSLTNWKTYEGTIENTPTDRKPCWKLVRGQAGPARLFPRARS